MDDPFLAYIDHRLYMYIDIEDRFLTEISLEIEGFFIYWIIF